MIDGAEAGGAAPPPSAPLASREPRRYRLLQLASLALIAGGLGLALAGVASTPELLSGEPLDDAFVDRLADQTLVGLG